MRLSKFIMTNLEEIVTEWESFASTMLPEKQFDRATLRDDAAQILSTIAQDMETPQTASQQTEKSQGLGPKTQQDISAETHSLVRLRQGFNQVQVISEFRAPSSRRNHVRGESAVPPKRGRLSQQPAYGVKLVY